MDKGRWGNILGGPVVPEERDPLEYVEGIFDGEPLNVHHGRPLEGCRCGECLPVFGFPPAFEDKPVVLADGALHYLRLPHGFEVRA